MTVLWSPSERDRPDLAEKAIVGELSANAAAARAGLTQAMAPIGLHYGARRAEAHQRRSWTG